MNIGFIGLGQMGRGMVSRLIGRGHAVTVWNRTPSAAAPLAKRGARVAAEPAQTLENEIVITMLADDAALDAVWIEPDLIRRLPSGTVHLNMASEPQDGAATRRASS